MVIHNSIICVSIAPLASAGILKPTVRKDGRTFFELWKKWAKQAKDKGYFYQPGGNGRESLIEFNALPEKYRKIIEDKIGNPHATAKLKSFVDYIERDKAAEEFFRTYRYGDNDELELPERLQKAYTANAQVLNAIRTIHNNRSVARKKMGGSMRSFWKEINEPVKECKATIGHKLPGTHLHLKQVYDNYVGGGNYESLISGKLGNKNTEKITPEIEAWIVNEMANTRQSIEMVYLKYLQECFKRSWRSDIEAAAFRHRVAQPRVQQLIDLARHGRKGLRKLHGHTFKLRKAKHANDIWVSDGTTLSWYYRTGNGKEVALATSYFVMDSMSQKILGYSTRPGAENFEMQLEAYRMALRTANAKPYQLKYDNQKGHKTHVAQEFYNKLAHVHFPTRAYRPSGKRVEFMFGKFQSMKLAEFPFWSGFGRTSWSDVNYSPNMEWIKSHVADLPNYEELLQLLTVVVNEWNELDFSGQGSPNMLYDTNRNPEEEPVDVQDLADMFWNLKGPLKYHQWGMKLYRSGEAVVYEVYDNNGNVDFGFRRRYLNQSLFVKYDPDGEYTDIELYIKDAGNDYRHIATAQPKREISESVKHLQDSERAWLDKQMKLEEQMMDEMDRELESIGYNDEIKATAWREKIRKPQPVLATGEIQTSDEDDEDWRLKL